MKILLVTILLFLCVTAKAATYYVKTNGSDSYTTTQAQHEETPWLTIGKAEDNMVAGDTVRVYPGTYNERVAEATDGSAGNFITYLGVGADGLYHGNTSGVIMRGFDLTGTDYIRIIGFEITHTASTWSRAISFAGNCSHVEILNNYIHNTYNEGGAIRAIGTSSTNNVITIRGNTFYHLGYVAGVFTLGNSMAVQSEEWNQSWLIEYNTVERAGDFVDVDSWNSVIRNNYIHDYADAYWTSGAGHADVFQPFSISNQVYEANFCGDNIEANSHYLQIRQNDAYGTNLIFRGNVGYNMGSYVAQLSGADRLRLYNNTFYNFGNVSYGTPFGWDDEPGTGEGSTDGLLRNNIMHTIDASSSGDMTAGSMVTLCGTCSATVDNNLSYNGPTTGGGVVSTADPLFVSTASKQFWLQGGSPAIGIAAPITTIASATGSGTSFDVAAGTAKDFCDGWGIVQGDWITLENGSTRQITGISGDTITVDASVSWTQGDDVNWGYSNNPDLGAFPSDFVPLSAAVLTSNGTTYTVTTTGNTRGVCFYVDGVPTTWDYASPYSATIASGSVTARAYPLYAQPVTYVDATYTAPPTVGAVVTMNVGTAYIR